jgi:predicted NACHT family NTPase
MFNTVHTTAAETLLRDLEADDDINKRALYRACRENGPIAYPLKVTLPELASPSLLDRVQNRPDVEGHLRVLKRQHTKERDNAVYIQPQAKSSLQASDDTRFPLMDKVKEFLGSDQKVFLLLGDSGAGKSTFSHELEFDLWQSYTNKADRIPLHINLPAIDKPEVDMIAKQLRRDEFTEPQIREMKHYRKFILICDGYDESLQTHNLYMSNRLNQPGEWDAQMVISCRSEYLGSDYRDRFQPVNRNQQQDSPLFQQAVITPFSNHQIHDYIKQYVSVNESLWHEEDYKEALDLIPSLKDLVKNPFLMALALDVLPRMVEPGQHLSSARVTRVALYDHFVEQWLERGKKRLTEKEMSPSMRETFEKLSAQGFTLNGIEYLKKFAVAIYKEQGGQPVVKYSQLIDQGTWKEAFFDSRAMQLLHEACPLARNGNNIDSFIDHYWNTD